MVTSPVQPDLSQDGLEPPRRQKFLLTMQAPESGLAQSLLHQALGGILLFRAPS